MFLVNPSHIGSGDQSSSQERARVTEFTADFKLDRNGDLELYEQIVVDMPRDRRGIFRIFDTGDTRRKGVTHPVTVESVTRNGEDEPYIFLDESATGTETIRIGRESVRLEPGLHTYEIVSRTVDVFEPGEDDTTVWWWDVIGSGWSWNIDHATIRVTVPDGLQNVDCLQAEQTPCLAAIEGNTITVTTGPLAPFTPVTLMAHFDADSVDTPIAGGHNLVDWVIAIILAAASAGGAIWLVTRLKERTPGFPVLFEPPEATTPAVGTYVMLEQHSNNELEATLYSLAERGVLTLTGQDDRWTVQLQQDPQRMIFYPGELELISGLQLFRVGDQFTISKTVAAGERLKKASDAMKSSVKRATREYLRTEKIGYALILLTVGAVAWLVFSLIRFFAFSNGGFTLSLVLASAAFVLVSIGSVLKPGNLTRRNKKGRDLWSRTGGFARFLTTDSSEARFNAAEHMDWYPRYLPWAVALGVADKWAERYESQGVATPAVPWLFWAGVGYQPSMQSISNSFNTSIASASAAYAASQASSSGGGGFSGGSGGGGGGGGSW